ncbi:trypsin-like peptidase domain-containing protein [Streptomyces sp. NPDC048172]|uniref:VMAP-C domain-containing protein n=1 Tax=Streptomyces sp. NPDC048172 TaxID=3365505 RepID=UPI0037102817
MNAPIGLESAVRPAVVRIGAPGGGYDRLSGRGPAFWGSGFFVAPGWVLTCAHVVDKGGAGVWRGERAIGIMIGNPDKAEVLTGELAFGLPAPEDPEAPRPSSPWRLPDLALVRVPEATDPDCLWLSDRSVFGPAEVGLYGWIPGAVKDEPLYFPGLGTATGGSAGGGSDSPVILSGSQLVEGCSGGPVVDVRRGAVIAVSKAKGRGPGPAIATPVTGLRRLCDAGPAGSAVLHEVLSAHDRHHLRRYHGFGASWPRLHARLGAASGEPAHGFTAERRAQLYALFAELEPPSGAGQVLGLAAEARDLVLQSSYTLRDQDPRSWREGAGLLYDPRDGRTPEDGPARDLALEAVVLYAAMIHAALARPGRPGASGRPGAPGVPGAPGTSACADTLTHLRAWIETTAVTLANDVIRARVPDILDGRGPAPADRAATRADVRVEIDLDLYGAGGHTWRVLLQRGTGDEQTLSPVAQSREEVPRERLEEEIREALSIALDQCDVDEHVAAVEFMLPRPLFDLPVDRWRARPYDPVDPFNPHTLPLGQRRLVVVRDRMRKDQGPTPEWRARAAGVAEGPLHAVPLRREVPEHGHDAPSPEGGQAAYGRLLAAPAGAVPVYCSRTGGGPGQRAMAAALTAGHAVALWRHTDGGHADCTDFHERADAMLSEARAAEHLPERIRTLRNGNADEEATDPGTAWARHIVLLYDPPHRPPRDGPLREPPLIHRPSA